MSKYDPLREHLAKQSGYVNSKLSCCAQAKTFSPLTARTGPTVICRV